MSNWEAVQKSLSRSAAAEYSGPELLRLVKELEDKIVERDLMTRRLAHSLMLLKRDLIESINAGPS